MSQRWSPLKSASDTAALAALGYVDAGGPAAERHPELLPFPSPCPTGR
jgi:hypothetical protein